MQISHSVENWYTKKICCLLKWRYTLEYNISNAIKLNFLVISDILIYLLEISDILIAVKKMFIMYYFM